MQAIALLIKRLSSCREQREMCLAVPGRVEAIYEEQGTRMGRVDFGGVVKEVCLACLPQIAVGDYTIVHVGFAISKIDEASAKETLKTFEELGLLEEELDELKQTACSADYRMGAGPQ
jgi:hydrogenase expression/formation protein HypC